MTKNTGSIKGMDLAQKQCSISQKQSVCNPRKRGKRETRRRLPFSMLVFYNQEDIKRTCNAQYILEMKMNIESLRKRSALISQMLVVQAHKNNCFKVPRISKCTGKHRTKNDQRAEQ